MRFHPVGGEDVSVGGAVAGMGSCEPAVLVAAKNPASPPVWKTTTRCWRVLTLRG
jgi:hypothetical protein